MKTATIWIRPFSPDSRTVFVPLREPLTERSARKLAERLRARDAWVSDGISTYRHSPDGCVLILRDGAMA